MKRDWPVITPDHTIGGEPAYEISGRYSGRNEEFTVTHTVRGPEYLLRLLSNNEAKYVTTVADAHTLTRKEVAHSEDTQRIGVVLEHFSEVPTVEGAIVTTKEVKLELAPGDGVARMWCNGVITIPKGMRIADAGTHWPEIFRQGGLIDVQSDPNWDENYPFVAEEQPAGAYRVLVTCSTEFYEQLRERTRAGFMAKQQVATEVLQVVRSANYSKENTGDQKWEHISRLRQLNKMIEEAGAEGFNSEDWSPAAAAMALHPCDYSLETDDE